MRARCRSTSCTATWRRSDAVDDLRALPLFEGLTDEQLGELVAAGDRGRIEPGVDLFREGEHADFWWVLVDGAIDLVRHIGREDVVVGRMDQPGRWAGGFRAWDEHGVYLATGRGVAAGRCSGCRRGVLRERSSAWFPFGGHLIEGLYRHRALHRVDGAAARVPGHPRHAGGRPRARDQQPRRPRTRAVDALEDA